MGVGAIEDVLELSPLQQGILFQTLYSPESGMYVEQLSIRLNALVVPQLLRRAWQKVLDRHSVLRTSFYWEDVEQPVQVVQGDVAIPFHEEDWSRLDSAEQVSQLQAYLAAERASGFDLSRAPLIRVSVIRLSETSCQLIVSLHHIILDGWSIALIFQEVSAYYEAYTQGRDLELDLSPPYGDYIAWLQGQDEKESETYWRKVLEGYKGPARLWVDRVGGRLTAEDEVSEEQYLMISKESTAALRSVARKYQLTLNTLVQGAWAILLSRYTGIEDVVFGATVSGRPAVIEGIESMIGLFINTLPVRVRVSSREFLVPWLKQLHASQLEARNYDYSPLSKIQSWSEAPRGIPLFHTLLAFDNYPWTGSENPDTNRVIGKIDFFEGNDYPLSVTVHPGETLVVKIAYVQRRFDTVTISRMLGHVRTLLEGIAADPPRRVSELPLLTEEEQQLTAEWNATSAEYPRTRCIHQLFEVQADRTPDAIAVVFGKQQLTYRELNQRSNQIAHYLRKQGVVSETLVGICMERSPELLIGILGILKAGGAYLPMDPAYPKARLSFMLRDARPYVLLTVASMAASLDFDGTLVCLDQAEGRISQEPVHNPPSNATAGNLAYVIYTSGSTGLPKGVMIEHASLVNHCVAVARRYKLGPLDRILQFASIAFDVFAEEVFPSLICGAGVVLRTDDFTSSFSAFLASITTHEVTVLNLPASYWQEWISDLEGSGNQPPVCVRLVIVGNEPVLPERWTQWRSLTGRNVESLNAYGPTEATITATIYEPLAGSENRLGSSVPIGRPIANAHVYVLDRELNHVPIGVAGEMYIGGASLARGYINHPALTAARFVPDPFSVGGRLYRTGDIGRYLSDANIEFLGRTDNQVKIRGHRVELEEVESALRAHASVQDCAVSARQDASGCRRLISYIVPTRAKPELWPSIGEYFLYDAVMYHAMTNDELRNQAYRVAISRHVKDKVVLDIGTGADAILARLCLDSGAKRVYAIEKLDASYEHARDLLAKLGLDDRIILLQGDSTEIQLPPVDVCVSELLGMIGSSEGVIPILNDARRLLKDGGVMIPRRCITKIAAVSLPDDLAIHPRFTELSGPYVQRIFETIGHPIDVRVCIRNLTEANVISDAQVFEDLDFNGAINTQLRSEITLTITRPSRIDGFLLWLNLFTVDDELIDTLQGDHNWLPIFFPVFYPGLEVSEGDVIRAVCYVGPSDSDATPDYRVQGSLIRESGETTAFDYHSFHSRSIFRQSRFHQALFADGWESDYVPLIDLAPILQAFLRDQLPEYLVPSMFVMVKSLPLLPNGKVDRSALPLPPDERTSRNVNFVGPRTALESEVADIWSEVLAISHIGVDDNFFELGGHSLLAMRVVSRVRTALQVELPLRLIFESPTISGLAAAIEQLQAVGPDTPITPAVAEMDPTEIEGLTDDEVNAMLSNILSQRHAEQ